MTESYKRILNRLGYYNYQHGFIVRHLNQEDGWNSHLENCRNFILRSLEIHKPERITVLGSGWLLELPLAELLEKVSKVRLVDIIHPPEVIEQAGRLPGVELITDDVSGGLIDEVWHKTSRFPLFNRLKSLEDIIVPEYRPQFDPGMVISLNILSQIETLLVRYLLKKAKISEVELMSFRRKIQENHLSFLKKYNSVLISDVTEIFTDKSGSITERQSVIAKLPEGICKEEWNWDFDLKGSDYFEKRSVFKVAAIIL